LAKPSAQRRKEEQHRKLNVLVHPGFVWVERFVELRWFLLPLQKEVGRDGDLKMSRFPIPVVGLPLRAREYSAVSIIKVISALPVVGSFLRRTASGTKRQHPGQMWLMSQRTPSDTGKVAQGLHGTR